MTVIRDLVRKSRSFRGYNENRRFTRKELEELADCARLCPSSLNLQPLKYYLSWEKEETDRIQKLTGWALKLQGMTLPHPGKCPAAYIIICQDTRISSAMNLFLRDVGAAAQTMLLVAAERGLGGCMLGTFKEKELKETLKLPEYLVPMLVVAFGEPDEKVVLTDLKEGESTDYYRDSQDIHYVPKRSLEDVIVTAETLE